MSSLFTEPQNPGGGQLIGKTGIGLLIGFVLAILVFALMQVLGSSFFVKSAGMFMAFILVIVSFVVTLIGMGIFSGLLNMAFGQDYYDFGKMFGFSVLANGLLVLLFLPIYLMMSGELTSLLFVYAIHVMFAFFISYTLVEFTTNPSYAASNLIGSTLGFGLTLVVYMAIYSMTMGSTDAGEATMGTNSLYLYILSPFLISYVLIPLMHGIWTQIYYSIYSGGNNPLFIPQLADITQTQEVEDEVTVEIPQQ
ncbi:hypothetical protein XF24_00567 [candidate division SR1 bacterium Aalborg_AAW-1]|nr:hypothetical protein XF24_00567 [candidate division SR1 bacterium Aalborg_AAW-1]